MPSIIINEIDETSAGTTSIVNDVAYVPGFSDKNSFVTVTSDSSPKNEYIKFIKDETPQNFVPELRIYQYFPSANDYFVVTQENNQTVTVTVTSFSETYDETTGITTGTVTYNIGSGADITGKITRKTETLYEVVPFKVVGLTSVKSVTYMGNFSIYIQNGEDVVSTADMYARSAIVGDFFYDNLQQDLYVASYAPNKGSVIEIEGTASVTVSSGSGTVNVGDITVGSVEGATSFSQSGSTLTINASDGTVDITVTGIKISAGGLVDVSTPTTSVSVGGLTTGTVKVDGTTVQYAVSGTEAPYTVTFTELFWNYIDQTNKNYTVTYVPENTPTYCSTKAQFEALFGEFPYKFEEIQLYGANMFTANATPSGSVMFRVGDIDPSYVYAKELICSGMPVYYDNVVNRLPDGSRGSVTVQHMYDYLLHGTDAEGTEGPYYLLQDPNEYNVKYITSGGYPLFEYTAGIAPTDNPSPSTPVPKPYEPAMNMMNVATTGLLGDTKNSDDFLGRGDIIALIDHTNNPSRSFTGDDSVWESLTGSSGAMEFWSDETLHCDPSYGVMFTPWFKYTTKFTQDYVVKNDKKVATGSFVIKMPASFAYLIGLANSIKNFPAWMAIAGVNRGQVQNYTGRTTAQVLTNKIAQQFQFRQDKSSINPITEVRPYGQCVYGNRTLKEHENGLTATAFLNIRNLVCDVKKTVYRAAKRCLFEQDTDVLWINFKSMITPTLDQMVTGQGISAYKILRLPTNVKAKMEAKVILYPIYAIEDIEVTVVMRDEEVSVTSNQ